ncbi:low molecular weight phosphatase family protein [Pseudanabaena sp. lw0831]|uniref:arsenate-mycothiol transferase ArsC n=1 Tax=Pseudanabaena sp. lw0831 TaxID=1357935 RepID=UPI001916B84A|nr:ArsC family transcriptional regulator [Pseudanabaena sp. lw0831]
MKNIMFVCKDNTYSQIAEAWMRDFTQDTISVASSGLSIGEPSPNFIRVMNEVGIDLSDHKTKLLSDSHPEHFDAVISLCNFSMRLPDKWMLRRFFDEWILPQPEGDLVESFRYIRDEIRDKVDVLLMRYPT